ncbi:MAG: class I SAM-dependent methyltransferase [Coxiellaceae bacterium]|nr:class I SAM-dependent methyltransferase [Coxiellaceae bacterium]
MNEYEKKDVFKVYDRIIGWFDEHRDKSLNLERKIIEIIKPYLSEDSEILDVGCGTGEPIAAYYLSLGYSVTGIDGSEKMIALCEKKLPSGRWIKADMRAKVLDTQFDLVIAWHSFFHLPREDQPATLDTLCDYVKPGGILVFTSGSSEREVWSDNGGEDLYHASLSKDDYQAILIRNDCHRLFHQAEDPDCGGATVWVAQKT